MKWDKYFSREEEEMKIEEDVVRLQQGISGDVGLGAIDTEKRRWSKRVHTDDW